MIKRLAKTITCIEIGSQTLYIWQVNQKRGVSPPEQITVPKNTLWNPQSLTQLIKGQIFGRKLLFLLNTSQTIVRLSDETVTASDIEKTFPFVKQPEEYVFSYDIIGEKTWITAVPSETPISLVEMCRLKGVRSGRIQAIDTLEYRMSRYLGNLHKSPFWLLLPQEPGIRLITLQNGMPILCYFFSNDSNFRLQEITRIWLCQPTPPQSAYILSDNPAYLWLHEFLKEKSVGVLEQDFKQSMIAEWVRSL